MKTTRARAYTFLFALNFVAAPPLKKLAPCSEQALADEASDDVPDEVPKPQEADVQPRDTEDAPGDADGRGEEQVHWSAGERPRAHGRGK